MRSTGTGAGGGGLGTGAMVVSTELELSVERWWRCAVRWSTKKGPGGRWDMRRAMSVSENTDRRSTRLRSRP